MEASWRYDDGGRAAAGYRGDAGDCVVRSIAIATERPYQDVYDELRCALAAERTIQASGGRQRRRSPRDGVPTEVARSYLGRLGWKWTATKRIGQRETVHLRGDELPGGRIIARLSGHFCAVVDGVVHDTYDPSRDGSRMVYGYWSKPSV